MTFPCLLFSQQIGLKSWVFLKLLIYFQIVLKFIASSLVPPLLSQSFLPRILPNISTMISSMSHPSWILFHHCEKISRFTLKSLEALKHVMNKLQPQSGALLLQCQLWSITERAQALPHLCSFAHAALAAVTNTHSFIFLV